MREVLTVEQVRRAEQTAIGASSEDALMQRAAHGLAVACVQLLADTSGGYGSRVVVLVGPGNNGGDALFAAGLLADRGCSVTAVSMTNTWHDGGGRAALSAGVHWVTVEDSGRVARAIDEAMLVIDGIFGIGGRAGLSGAAVDVARWATDSKACVVAVDVPSGVDADSGRATDDAVWADVTVTFGSIKPGLVVTPGCLHAGVVEVVDIGLADARDSALPGHQAPIGLLDVSDVRLLLPTPTPGDHKYSRGVVAIVAGSIDFPGAAVLAVAGAGRTGAGMVRYYGPAVDLVTQVWPQAVPAAHLSAEQRIDAVVVGPGLSVDPDARIRLETAIALDRPLVIDADALTLMSPAEQLNALVTSRSSPVVLTPHAGEARRLVPGIDISAPLSAAQTLAAATGAVVLLKGFTTVVAAPTGEVLINPTGTPWLATAGTGDVLAGMIGTYLAAGLAPVKAAAVAAYVHGLAARLAAADAPASAMDIASAIPAAVRAIVDLPMSH